MYTSPREVIYLYRRKGLSYWSTCDADQYMGFLERPLFEVKIARNDIDYADLEHEVDKLRERVAELEASPLMAPEEARAGIALQLKEIERLRAENAKLSAQLIERRERQKGEY